MTVTSIDAVLLGGGSLFGLDAAGGAVGYLRQQGRGLKLGSANIPVAVQAIIFDLNNGGDKDWGRMPPYWELGWQATETASVEPFALGTVGGGYGATTATFKGGLGSTSATTASGFKVGAIAVVNAIGSTVVGKGPHFWAAPWEVGAEFGGLGQPAKIPRGRPRAAHEGPRPLRPPPSPSSPPMPSSPRRRRSGSRSWPTMEFPAPSAPRTRPWTATPCSPSRRSRNRWASPAYHLTEIGLAAADCLARAIARGVYEATALPFPGATPAWRDRFAGERPRNEPGRMLVAVVLAAALLVLLGWQLHRERMVKACLSAGGAWDGAACGPLRLRPILRRELERS